MLMVYNGNVYMDEQDRRDMMTLCAPELPPDGPVAMWLAWGERHLAEPPEDIEGIFRTTAVEGILQQINEALKAQA